MRNLENLDKGKEKGQMKTFEKCLLKSSHYPYLPFIKFQTLIWKLYEIYEFQINVWL